MNLPALLLAFLLASLYGLAFYFVFGRGWLGLALYWIAALIGFALGQIVSTLLAFRLLPIGSINIVEASVASVLVLFLARMLFSRVR